MPNGVPKGNYALDEMAVDAISGKMMYNRVLNNIVLHCNRTRQLRKLGDWWKYHLSEVQ